MNNTIEKKNGYELGIIHKQINNNTVEFGGVWSMGKGCLYCQIGIREIGRI